MFSALLRAAEYLFSLLLVGEDRVSRLPRDTTIPDAKRLYRENIALGAQLDCARRRGIVRR